MKIHVTNIFYSYRIQHSLDKCAAPNSQMQEYMTVQRISNAVQIHKEALKSVIIISAINFRDI